jgi:hypothetical protein
MNTSGFAGALNFLFGTFRHTSFKHVRTDPPTPYFDGPAEAPWDRSWGAATRQESTARTSGGRRDALLTSVHAPFGSTTPPPPHMLTGPRSPRPREHPASATRAAPVRRGVAHVRTVSGRRGRGDPSRGWADGRCGPCKGVRRLRAPVHAEKLAPERRARACGQGGARDCQLGCGSSAGGLPPARVRESATRLAW